MKAELEMTGFFQPHGRGEKLVALVAEGGPVLTGVRGLVDKSVARTVKVSLEYDEPEAAPEPDLKSEQLVADAHDLADYRYNRGLAERAKRFEGIVDQEQQPVTQHTVDESFAKVAEADKAAEAEKKRLDAEARQRGLVRK